MRAETRFLGNGNIWVGNHTIRGWQVTCSGCGVSKTISSHHGSMLPPHMIIRKLVQSGWYIGNRPEEDACVNCRRKSKKLNGAAPAPLPSPATLREAIETAKAKLATKEYGRASHCLDVALVLLNVPPPPVLPVEEIKPVQETAPDDYDQWLASLSGEA